MKILNKIIFFVFIVSLVLLFVLIFVFIKEDLSLKHIQNKNIFNQSSSVGHGELVDSVIVALDSIDITLKLFWIDFIAFFSSSFGILYTNKFLKH